MDWHQQYRFRHTYILGASGTGKSTTLQNFALDDITAGSGLLFIDPHGDDIDALLANIPKERRADVILYDPSDHLHPVGFNPFYNIPLDRRPLVASTLVDTMKAMWDYTGFPTPDLDQVIYNATAAMLDMPDGTLLGMKFLLTSEHYRARVLPFVTDPIVSDFWRDFNVLEPKRQDEKTKSTLNKLGALLSDPRVRNSIGQPESAIDLTDILNTGKILLVRVPQGQLGIQKARMIGSLILASVHAAALARTSTVPFHIYIDECHHFAGPTLIEMLSGIRKFNVSLTLAHQYVEQLPIDIRSAVFGNVATKICFRVGSRDAELLKHEFFSNHSIQGIDQLPFREVRVKHPAVSRADQEFETLPHQPLPDNPRARRSIANLSRRTYALPRASVQRRLDLFIAGAVRGGSGKKVHEARRLPLLP